MKVLLILFLNCFSLLVQNIERDINEALSSGDVKLLSQHFTSSIKLSLHREEQVANKSKAEWIIADYLKDNKFSDLKKTSRLEDGNSNFIIYEAKVQRKEIRILIKLVNLKNTNYISEIIIE